MVRDGHPRRKDHDRSREAIRNPGLACSHHSGTSSKIFKIRKLLLTIHSRIFGNHMTTEWTTEERQKVWIDSQMSRSLQQSKNLIHKWTSVGDARLDKTIPDWMWCIQVHVGSSANSTRFQWRPKPMHLHFKNILPHQKEPWIYDQELLAIIWALEEWRHYIQGPNHTTVNFFSNHKNLIYF